LQVVQELLLFGKGCWNDPSPFSFEELQTFGGFLAFGGVPMVPVLYLLGAGA
jgi:hypothetical protein